MRVLPVTPDTTLKIGDSLYTLPAELTGFACTQGPSGTVTDANGQTYPIMVTAGHCVLGDGQLGPLKPDVYVPLPADGSIDLVKVGTKDKVGPITLAPDSAPLPDQAHSLLNTTDWATVRIDDPAQMSRVSASRDEYGRETGAPRTLTGVRDYPDLGPWQVAVDNAGQPICKDGTRTGRSCGIQLARTEHGVWSWDLSYAQGDSGGVNYDPRTGEVIGVTSMALGRIGRTQPVDRALEAAYDIPDGQVNERFKLAESTAGHADYATFNDELVAVEDTLKDQGFTTPPPPDFRAEFNAEVASAQREAQTVGYQAQRLAADAAGAATSLATGGNSGGNGGGPSDTTGTSGAVGPVGPASAEDVAADLAGRAASLAQRAAHEADVHGQELAALGFAATLQETLG